ncbi:glycosyltransferase [Aliiroseovarius sp. YM-037]|uniref:glycosyltransferase n=1 Tax=Aliiroseovarius sp. YM-037 TaxID=3341728 RepID=UPI003A80B9E6
MTDETTVGAVIIGRNEGERLVRCLDSLVDAGVPLVYVDSGSTDNSLAEAKARGALIVELDTTVPFTAARARTEGFEALAATGSLPDYVQFVDGDCGVEPGWIAAGKAELDRDDKLGIVTGWRSEIHRDHSIYNAICDFEWHRPAGEIVACGGDMMVRSTAFQEVGGFNPVVIAGEDDEFCVRVGKAGWKLRRLPLAMTRHDAAMTRFSEWWRRAVRTGHAFAQVGDMHDGYFGPERRRVLIFGGLLPLIALIALFVAPWVLLLVALAYVVSYWRTVKGLERDGLPSGEAAHQGVFLSLSKFPNIIGMATYFWRRLRGHKMNIIEYK